MHPQNSGMPATIKRERLPLPDVVVLAACSSQAASFLSVHFPPPVRISFGSHNFPSKTASAFTTEGHVRVGPFPAEIIVCNVFEERSPR